MEKVPARVVSEADTFFVRLKCVFGRCFFLGCVFFCRVCVCDKVCSMHFDSVGRFFSIFYAASFYLSIDLTLATFTCPVFTSTFPAFASRYFTSELKAFFLVYFNYLVTQFVTTSCEIHFFFWFVL